MADLRNNALRMQQLIDHIVRREGIVRYFYCDSRMPRGLVTIGIGHLVDAAAANINAGQALARALFNQPGVEFRHKVTRNLGTEQQVVNDWTGVRAHGVTHPGLNSAGYAPVAQYRIADGVARMLLRRKLDHFIEQLYARRPFAIDLDERIQMALVDVRYNPAGVGLFDMADDPGDNFHPGVPRLWNALNPDSPEFDVENALLIFEDIWSNRGNARYRERHRQRTVMFWAGSDEMSRRAQGRYQGLIGNLAAGRF